MDAPPGPHSPHDALIGRASEIRILRDLLVRGREQGQSLVLAGERGVGKTRLLDEACLVAGRLGYRALRLDGCRVADDSTSAIGVMMAQLDVSGAAQHTAASRLVAGNELLRLLRAHTVSRPVLVAIDDAHRLDRHSASILAFIGRRLSDTKVVMLATTELTGADARQYSGIPTHLLGCLSTQEATRLLDERFPDLAFEVAQRVIADACGSTLALVELPRGLTERQRHGSDPLPVNLPLTDRLREVHGSPLATLPATVREALLLLAVAGRHDLPLLLDAAGDDSESMAAFDLAEGLGLIDIHDGGSRVGFRHPLTRTAVLDAADAAHLRDVNNSVTQALLDPDRRAWHLSEGVHGADQIVADGLELTARRAAARGDAEGAANAMARAAELSPEAAQHGRRLIAAAHLRASVTGELEAAEQLLEAASVAHPASARTLRAAVTSAQLALAGGARLDDVAALLIDALKVTTARGNANPDETGHAFQLLFYICLMAARAEPWTAFQQQLERLEPDLGPTFELLSRVLPDVRRCTGTTLASMDRAISRLPDVADATEVVRISIAAFHLDRLSECRAALSEVVEQARDGHSPSAGAEAMLRLSLDDCMTGQFARGVRLADEGLALARGMGQTEREWAFQVCLALVAALRGDKSKATLLTGEMSAWAVPRGAMLVADHCAYVHGLLALGEGDFDTAFRHTTSISPAGTLAPRTNLSTWAALDLVEAAVHTDRAEAARAHAATLADSGIGDFSPRLSLRVAAATAMVAGDAHARVRFEEALAVEQTERWPFERARVELAYGERLRRLREPADAQQHLTVAYETFRRLGARPWAKRTAQQMRAAGLPMPAHERPPLPALAGRDREIAMLAAAGLTNQQIGEKLFVSPRTVGSRLYRIFPLLGVSSRAALRDALTREPDDDV